MWLHIDHLLILLIQLSKDLPYFCSFFSDQTIPFIKNDTEQVIGRTIMVLVLRVVLGICADG